MKMKMEFASEEAKHFFITHTHTTVFISFDFFHKRAERAERAEKEIKVCANGAP